MLLRKKIGHLETQKCAWNRPLYFYLSLCLKWFFKWRKNLDIYCRLLFINKQCIFSASNNSGKLASL